jgi:hypothetical protein
LVMLKRDRLRIGSECLRRLYRREDPSPAHAAQATTQACQLLADSRPAP